MTDSTDEIKVLHIDDDPDFAELVAEFLEREDERISVQTAASADEGLKQLSESSIDCIVSDYDMPRQNGIEFLETVREDYPDLPFILFTGKGSESVASEAISVGVSDYLQKKSGRQQYELLANRVGTLVDKYRNEQELDKLQRQFTKLVHQNFVGIYIIQDGEFVYVNPRLAEIHGYDDPEAIIGMSPLELVAPDERERVQSNLEQRMSGEVAEIQYQTVGLTKDGDLIDIELHGSHIELDGEPAVIGAEADITERKERERELENLYQTYRDLFDGINDAVFVHKLEGEMLDVNGEAIERHGYTEEELLELTPEDIDAPDHAPHAADRIETIEEEGAHIFESVHVTKSGERIPVEISSSVIDYFGHKAVLSVARDITERKEYERDLEQANEQLRLINRIVRHDIRNDMNLVLGWGEELKGKVDEEGEQMLNRILENGQHTVDLTKTLRDFMRAYDDETIEYTPTYIDEVIENETERLEERYPTAEVDTPEEVPHIQVRANDLITTVFWNLLQNAVKHNDKELPRVEIGVEAEAKTVMVRVGDNGPGIPDQQRDAIFGKGESGLDDSNAGMGLYLINTVVEQYGGDVWVKENEPEGATFVVELPKANAGN